MMLLKKGMWLLSQKELLRGAPNFSISGSLAESTLKIALEGDEKIEAQSITFADAKSLLPKRKLFGKRAKKSDIIVRVTGQYWHHVFFLACIYALGMTEYDICLLYTSDAADE
eukprot:TRINITY_DN4930_c0_g1_i1.p1 TRINITY_DN4930_c0_g1~~TRINITY_DN4930_c0_g1_i1.p1  ORF type:complete len:113 (+),score=25.25 TRINITY_DN4930_c0_g1_i1:111-449(+)